MFINIKISSKNKKSLQNFLKVFELFCEKKNLKSNTFIKYFSQKQKTSNIYTILKSPHVNKKAQEQFEYSIIFKTNKCFFISNV